MLLPPPPGAGWLQGWAYPISSRGRHSHALKTTECTIPYARLCGGCGCSDPEHLPRAITACTLLSPPHPVHAHTHTLSLSPSPLRWPPQLHIAAEDVKSRLILVGRLLVGIGPDCRAINYCNRNKKWVAMRGWLMKLLGQPGSGIYGGMLRLVNCAHRWCGAGSGEREVMATHRPNKRIWWQLPCAPYNPTTFRPPPCSPPP